MISAIIVEDSRLARLELKEQLKSIAYIDVVAEASTIEDAIVAFNQHLPSLVFLDIDLPDGSGFDFLATIEETPKVIFTTAFENFALQAFEKNAVDYLLKPYTESRLIEACNRLKLQDYELKNTDKNEQKLSPDSQFFVKDGKNCWLATLNEVERFEAMGNYTRLHFKEKKPMIYRSLSQLEKKLPKELYFRVNRQNIVQLSHIKNVEQCSSGALELTLTSGEITEISRRQTQLFKELFML